MTLRLTVALTAIVALAASGALYLAWTYGKQAADQAYDRLLRGASLQIAERVSVVDKEIFIDLPPSAFELLALARNDRIFYRIIGPNGTTLTGREDLPVPSAESSSGTRLYSAVYSGEVIRAVEATRTITERDLSGTVRIIVAQTVGERGALMQDITMKAAILIGIAALAIVVLSLLAVRYALAPLARVERALHGRDPNDLSAFVIETPRELETIVGAINHFIHRLNRRVAAVQNFVADAAHQLRTPITAIRAQAELALAEQDPEKLRNINQRILDRSAAVGRLADQLLSKAMISHRSDTVKREPVDLRRVAMEAEEETRSLLVSEGDSIHLELPENPVIVMGDRFSLREAAKNMINNARAHGIAPYCMRVSANAECGKLGVHDAGPGIPMALRGSIGDRFATPLVRGSTGAGLGLAIVNEVAIHHGGVLACADCAGGFEVTLELPIWREPK